MCAKIRLLLVEDERMLAEILSDTLSDRDFVVTLAADGEEALEEVARHPFDVIVSDVMMPRMDGFTLARRLRQRGLATPILFLTARSATEDVVKGFEVGGNDFLRKPFAIDELIVRVRALVGRTLQEEFAPCYEVGRYRFEVATSTLRLGNDEELLAAREAAVLARLCRRMGQTVEASAILSELWGDDNYFNLRSLNVYISHLRRRLAGDPAVKIISKRGVGYQLQVEKDA